MTISGECPFPIGMSNAAANELHDRLRYSGRTHDAVDPDGIDVVVVTHYDDVAALLVDPRIVNRRPGGTNAADGARRSPGLQLPPALANNLLNMWPNDHRRVRALAAPAFSRRRMTSIRPVIEKFVNSLLDKIESTAKPTETVDLLADLTSPLPAMVITEILGIELEEADEFRSAATNMMAIDPANPASDTLRLPAMTKIVMVLLSVIARKRENPTDDVISEWISARDEQQQLTEQELIALAFLVFIAGFENSVYQIANGFGVLLETDDRADLLAIVNDEKAWRARADRLVLEAAPGSYAIRRFPNENIEVGDRTIERGTPLLLSLRAATNDPARGDRPDLAFGRGPHYCLGAELAVIQLEIATREAFRRWPNMKLTQPLESLATRQTWRTQGPTSLPVFVQGPTGRVYASC